MGLPPLPPCSRVGYTQDSSNICIDVTAALNHTRGPILEVAGPTREGYPMIDPARLKKRVWLSNLFSGLPLWIRESAVDRLVSQPGYRRFEGPMPRAAERVGMRPPNVLWGRVDLQADGTALPIRPGSVGAILISRLNGPARNGAMREAYRALEPGGLLIWKSVGAGDLQFALSLGFELVAMTPRPNGKPECLALQKPR